MSSAFAEDLVRIRTLVVVVGVDDLGVATDAMDGQITVLGSHVGAVRPVDDPRVGAEGRRTPEEAHLMALRPNCDLDPQGRQERRRPEARAGHHDGRADVAARGADPGDPLALAEDGMNRLVGHDRRAKFARPVGERVRRGRRVGVPGFRLVGGRHDVLDGDGGHERLHVGRGDQPNARPDRLRPRHVAGEIHRLVRADQHQVTDLLEARVAAADDVAPALEDGRRRAGSASEEVHAVEAPDHRGRAPGWAGGQELPLHQEDAARLLAREVVGEARSVDAAPDDDDIGRARKGGHGAVSGRRVDARSASAPRSRSR